MLGTTRTKELKASVAGQKSGMADIIDNCKRTVRGVVYADVPDLTAFTVANNGITYEEGDRVLLPIQTTAAQCGVYVVGVVATGVAPLTRARDMLAGETYQNGVTFEVGAEGTLGGGSSWKAMCTGTKVVGTDDPLFYPKTVSGVATLALGLKALGSAEGLFLFSATKSSVAANLNTPGGTLTATTGYRASVKTPGKSGTAVATIIATVAAGTVDTANTSTVDYTITNW